MSMPNSLPHAVNLGPEKALRIRAQFRALSIPDEGLFLVGDRECHVFEGQVFVDLCPLLAEGKEESAIADILESVYQRSVVHYAIGLLAERGVLTKSMRHGTVPEEAFWDEFQLDSCTVNSRLAMDSVAITKIGAVKAARVVRALAKLGMEARMSNVPSGESLHVVITDDYLDPRLAELAEINRRDRRPWLLVRGAGSEIWIGPLFIENSACLECLAWRMRTNHVIEGYLARRLGGKTGTTRAVARIELLDDLVANLIALEIAKWAGGSITADAQIKAIDLRAFETTVHPLKRRPQCKVCGDAQLQAEIQTQPVCIAEDEKPAWATINDLTPFISKISGVITDLVQAETGLASLYSYLAFFGFGRDAEDFKALRKSFLSQAAGVGTSAEAAKIGAICEALERYSGMYHGDEPAIRAAYVDLDPAETIHPNACMQYSASQYARRVEINAREFPFDLVPIPFDENVAMDWTGVWSLSERRFKLVPSTYLFYNYPKPPGGPYCWADSNGCAAGKTFTDAIRRGLYELVERDSVAIWWYNRLRRPRVDLGSFHCDYFDDFVKSYTSLGRDAWVLDITSDLGIPSFVAISRSARGRPEDILLSFGSHLESRIALEHALCEMNHLLPAVLPQNRTSSGDYPYPDRAQKAWWSSATIESEPYLLPDPAAPPLRADNYVVSTAGSEAEQTNVLCERLQVRGFEVLVLNQTRPDVKIPVAKVISPGLRHFWSRLAPGRLYDVPVSMNWLPRPHTEDELNPIAMFV
jgi:oxazoline/thiazoline synthase